MSKNENMKTKLLLNLVALALLVPFTAFAQTDVVGVRMWPAPDNTRLVFDVNGPVEHNIFALEGPDRLVIDLKDTRLATDVEQPTDKNGLLTAIRYATRDRNDLRIVLDLAAPVRPKTFNLKPNDQYGYRLVIDLFDSRGQIANAPSQPRSLASEEQRPVVIAIDAGHGGEDPGAMGPHRTREKDVVLAIARQLEKLVSAEYGMQPLMIRDGDYFIKLGDRVKKARDNRADFFVSIHADAFHDARARGASVYMLSRNGASSTHAKMLADKENDSDLIGGVSLDDKDDLVASVLLDLSLTAKNEVSFDVAQRVLSQLDGVSTLHRRAVERAGFRVLKSPDLPSILVETAFISNPKEERKLKDPRYQRQMAAAIMDGIRSYFKENPPRDTILAALAKQRHVISRGDTLSTIAHRYRVDLDTLRSVNGLHSNLLKVGDTLRIPASSDG